MEDHLNIVLYSKFSASCAKFMEMIGKVPTFKHTTICIDNAEVRKRILTSKKLTIKQVPSIIRLYQKNGYAESFEGERAFSLLNAHYVDYLQEMTKDMALSREKELLEKKFDESQMTQLLPAQQSITHLSPPSSSISSISSPLSSPPPPNDPSGMSTTNMRSVLSTSVATNGPSVNGASTGGQTSLENLMDLSDLGGGGDNQNENALNTYHHVAPVANVSISGNIKKDAGSSANIVSRAMQMQKERENETSTNSKIPSV